MSIENATLYGSIGPAEARPYFPSTNTRLRSEFSKETLKDAGIKVIGATIFTIGLYKVASGRNLTDLVIGGVLMYAGYKIFKHKLKA